MNHITDFVIASALVVAAAVGTMWAVQPKPKPEAPETTQESLKRCEKNPERMCVVRVEADAAKTEAERVKEIEKELGDIKAKQQSLTDLVKRVTAEEKRK